MLRTDVRVIHPGINELDNLCKNHDLSYAQNDTLEDRHKADFILDDQTWNRVKCTDATLGEKAAAYAVTTVLMAQHKIGVGRQRCRCVGKLSFHLHVSVF